MELEASNTRKQEARSGMYFMYMSSESVEVDKVVHRLWFHANRLSYKGRMVNALASGADEGRDKLR